MIINECIYYILYKRFTEFNTYSYIYCTASTGNSKRSAVPVVWGNSSFRLYSWDSNLVNKPGIHNHVATSDNGPAPALVLLRPSGGPGLPAGAATIADQSARHGDQRAKGGQWADGGQRSTSTVAAPAPAIPTTATGRIQTQLDDG